MACTELDVFSMMDLTISFLLQMPQFSWNSWLCSLPLLSLLDFPLSVDINGWEPNSYAHILSSVAGVCVCVGTSLIDNKIAAWLYKEMAVLTP